MATKTQVDINERTMQFQDVALFLLGRETETKKLFDRINQEISDSRHTAGHPLVFFQGIG